MLCLLAIGLEPARSEKFTDDFNRENTEWVQPKKTAPPIGDNYTVVRGKFRILDGILDMDNSGAPGQVIQINSPETFDTDGRSFTASVDFQVKDPGENGGVGLTFHYQDPFHFYFVRFRGREGSLQFGIKNGNDEASTNSILSPGVHLEPQTWYRLTISGSARDRFHYALYRVGDPPEEVISGEGVIQAPVFDGGHLTLYIYGEGGYQFDNLSLETSGY